MIHLTKPDAVWLMKLLTIVEDTYDLYPEMFNEEDEDTLKVAGELIRSINR